MTRPAIQIFICNPHDAEERWMKSQYLEGLARHELEQDHQREDELARAYFADALPPGLEWPWYADRPWEVQEPEVIEA